MSAEGWCTECGGPLMVASEKEAGDVFAWLECLDCHFTFDYDGLLPDDGGEGPNDTTGHMDTDSKAQSVERLADRYS